MTVSGRLLLTTTGISVDDTDIVNVVDIEDAGPDFLLIYQSICDACEGHGYKHGRQCEWCKLVNGEYLDQPQATLPVSDLPALRAWALRQQFRDDTYAMARAVLDGLKKLDAQVAGAQTERSAHLESAAE